MGELDERLTNCEKLIIDFFKDINSIKALDMIIDIYDEIRYSQVDSKIAYQKFLRVLYNLKKSDSLNSLLEEEDQKILCLFLEDFLSIKSDGEFYYIEDEHFCKLTLDELYNVLIKIKYLKIKENTNNKQLSI